MELLSLLVQGQWKHCCFDDALAESYTVPVANLRSSADDTTLWL